jgi:SUR7/PalI family
MMFFVILSGVTDHSPLNTTYFLRVKTSGIDGARPISQWTYFYVCGDSNQDCGAAVAALPFGYAWYGNTTGVPPDLVGCVRSTCKRRKMLTM